MIFMFVIIGIIIQKNTLCTNKFSVTYFCPNCVNFFPKNPHFLFLGRQLSLSLPPSSCAYGCESRLESFNEDTFAYSPPLSQLFFSKNCNYSIEPWTCYRFYILFTRHLTRHQINQTFTITFKIMTDIKSFLCNMTRKLITFFKIFCQPGSEEYYICRTQLYGTNGKV